MIAHKDMREWIEEAKKIGELKVVPGASTDLEIGTITQINAKNEGPALLFDDVKDYKKGFRILASSLVNMKTFNLTFGLPIEMTMQDAIDTLSRRMSDWLISAKQFPFKIVDSGPILENVDEGDRVDLSRFPVPLWNKLDGGRYIGTGDLIITRDPDTGKVNVGTYRSQMHDSKTVGFYISPGKDGRLHRDKYFERKEPCPVVMVFGADPLLFAISSLAVPRDICELDYVGAVRGESVPVIKGRITGLPIPADAEIAIEGYSSHSETIGEGPFGEWTGHYGSGERGEPFVKVSALYYRNDPILLGVPSPKATYSSSARFTSILLSSAVKAEIEAAGVPNVKGVWCCPYDGWGKSFIVVSIKQSYAGHATQAGHAAASVKAGAFMGKYVIVVDDDVDPYDIEDVVWAMCHRSEPLETDVIKKSWSGPLNPRLRKPATSGYYNSRAIIFAVKPYEWIDEFPPVAVAGEELRQKTFSKWSKTFDDRWRKF